MAAEYGDAPADRVTGAYRLALARAPTDEELQLSLAALAQFAAEWRTKLGAEDTTADQRALGNFCHAIMNSAELMYVD